MARTTLREALAGLAPNVRLVSRVRKLVPRLPSQTRSTTMNLSILDGYKTYMVAAVMLLAAAAQLLGVDLPTFEGQSSGHLLMEGLAIVFLRRGMKSAA
jgi:hypothetical protein